MEINLQNLAQLQRPQMMPTPPLGAGTMAGLDYGQQNAQFQDTLKQIAPIAEAAGQEQMQGIQGRMAMQPQQQAQLMMESRIKALTPYASAWDAAQSDDEKQTILEEIQNDPSVPKQKDWSKMPLDVADKFMKMTRSMGVNTPQHAQQSAVWGTRMQGAKDVAGIKTEGAKDIADTKQAGAERIAQINAAARLKTAELMQQGKEALVKNEESIMNKIRNGTATPTDRAVLGMIQENHIAGAALMAGSKPAQVDIPAVTGGKVPMLPTPKPQLAPIPENAPIPVAKPNPTPVTKTSVTYGGQSYPLESDSSGTYITVNGKKIYGNKK